MYTRQINLPESYSFFLFGARATGKSTLLREIYAQKALYIDLLLPETEVRFGSRPSELIEVVEASDFKTVVIDEIQKLPKLLDVVHSILSKRNDIQFILTGSSARRLKRGNANLLAGRAFDLRLFPFSFIELKEDFNLIDCLNWGMLPQIFHFKTDFEKKLYLQAYIQTYIKEEILVEQLVRNIDPFRSFLPVAAQMSGEIVNYSRIAREASISSKSVERYFSILTDTLLAFQLNAFHLSVRKRQILSPKIYLFDLGVLRALSNNLETDINLSSYYGGKLFEHFIILEVLKLNHYSNVDYDLSYLKTKDGVEIDLILSGKDSFAIEIKATSNVTDDHLRGIRSLASDLQAKAYVLSLDNQARNTDEGIRIRHWRNGLEEIFKLNKNELAF